MSHTKQKEVRLSRQDFVTNYPHFRYWRQEAVTRLQTPPPVNIYLHVPYCTQKCAYCYYKTEILENRTQLERLTDLLVKEIGLVSARYGMKQRPTHSIYIGGGTPSLLTEDMLKRIKGALEEHVYLVCPEFTIEAEPRTITDKKIKMYKELGVNRISMGVQSFTDKVIKASQRNHSADKALQSIKKIQDAGGIVLNIDLLSGLAEETDESFKESVQTALDAGVDSLTIYKMEVYHNTDFFNKSVRQKVLELPNDEQEIGFMKQAQTMLNESNYKPFSWFTYTRDGQFPHSYVMNMWKGEDVCAFGPSAFGLMDNFNYQNATQLDHYFAALEENNLPMARGFHLSSKHMMLRDIMLGMKLMRFHRQLFVERHGFDIIEFVPETAAQLEESGFILLEEEAINLTDKGALYGDYVGKRLATAFKEKMGMDELNLY